MVRLTSHHLSLTHLLVLYWKFQLADSSDLFIRTTYHQVVFFFFLKEACHFVRFQVTSTAT
jgi:hypothetical protein